MDYKIEYLKLFNKITDTIKVLERETTLLKAVQIKTEAMIFSDEVNEPNDESDKSQMAMKLFKEIVEGAHSENSE
ncbi:MAG: hypothetical protein FWH08_02950 [Oscillospiraceae bacterium]|nr:hypothetical protein [Oscillospiraceae bacterium]